MSEDKPYDKENLTCLFTKDDWEVWERINNANKKAKRIPKVKARVYKRNLCGNFNTIYCSECKDMVALDQAELDTHNFWFHLDIEKVKEFFDTHEPDPNINLDAVMILRGLKKKPFS